MPIVCPHLPLSAFLFYFQFLEFLYFPFTDRDRLGASIPDLPEPFDALANIDGHLPVALNLIKLFNKSSTRLTETCGQVMFIRDTQHDYLWKDGRVRRSQ